MVDFKFGPVELYFVALEDERPSPGVVKALTDLLDGGLVRLVDFLIVSKSEDGEVTVVEVVDEAEAYGFGGVDIAAAGLVGDEDVEELAELIEPGTSAAVVALELSYARSLASALAASGSVVLRTERIPAPIVNAVLELAELEA
jgi:uncharacterized membrane protein